MTSPSPARSKTTPLSGKLSAGRIVKKYQTLRKTGLLYLGFIFLELQLFGWFAFAFDIASTSHTAAEN